MGRLGLDRNTSNSTAMAEPNVTYNSRRNGMRRLEKWLTIVIPSVTTPISMENRCAYLCSTTDMSHL